MTRFPICGRWSARDIRHLFLLNWFVASASNRDGGVPNVREGLISQVLTSGSLKTPVALVNRVGGGNDESVEDADGGRGDRPGRGSSDRFFPDACFHAIGAGAAAEREHWNSERIP